MLFWLVLLLFGWCCYLMLWFDWCLCECFVTLLFGAMGGWFAMVVVDLFVCWSCCIFC